MDAQETVAAFLDANDLHAPPAYRLLDLTAEVGELAADATASTEYGATPAQFELSRDELGDALFALLALAEETDTDAAAALAESLAKYEDRMADDPAGSPGSGE
jgi:NTP pyrophosphatase (non-canonical NTP hydrolase)